MAIFKKRTGIPVNVVYHCWKPVVVNEISPERKPNKGSMRGVKEPTSSANYVRIWGRTLDTLTILTRPVRFLLKVKLRWWNIDLRVSVSAVGPWGITWSRRQLERGRIRRACKGLICKWCYCHVSVVTHKDAKSPPSRRAPNDLGMSDIIQGIYYEEPLISRGFLVCCWMTVWRSQTQPHFHRRNTV